MQATSGILGEKELPYTTMVECSPYGLFTEWHTGKSLTR